MSSFASLSCLGSEAKHFGDAAAPLNPRLEEQAGGEPLRLRKRWKMSGEEPRHLREEGEERDREREVPAVGRRQREEVAAPPPKATEAAMVEVEEV